MQIIDPNELNPTDPSGGSLITLPYVSGRSPVGNTLLSKSTASSKSTAEIFTVGSGQPDVKPGRFVVYIKAPNKAWEKFLRYVARFHGRLGLTWDGLVAAAAAKYNADPSRPKGLKIRFLKSGEYTRIKEANGKVTTIPRKGFDESRRALYFVVEFK